MIHRTRFIRRCREAGMSTTPTASGTLYWRAPISVLLWWNYDAVYLLPNTEHALRVGNRFASALACFTDLDEALATYTLLNP